MSFDPDAYLKKTEPGFDPDAYLQKETAFDPDKYLEQESKPQESSYLPFTGQPKEYSDEINAQARDFLKQQGYDADSWSDTAITGIMSMANTLSFGQSPKLAAKAYGVSEDVYRAALDMREKNQPLTALAGNIAGYIPGGALKGAKALAVPAAQAVGVAVEEAEEGDMPQAVVRTLGEEALGLGAGVMIGKAFGAAIRAGRKGSKASPAKALEDGGFDSEQAERIGKQFAKERQLADDTIKSIESLTPKQREEFNSLILQNVPLAEASRYGDMGQALEDYKDLVARRAANAEAAGLDPQTANRAALFYTDAQYAGDGIDRRWGTNFMYNMNTMSDQSNKASHLASRMRDQAVKTIENFRPKTVEESKKIIKQVEAGLDSPEASAYRDMFDSFLDQANDAAVDAGYTKKVIPKRENYIPHYTKGSEELVATLRQEIEKTLGGRPRKIGAAELSKITENEQLLDSLTYIGRINPKSVSFSKIEEVVNDLYSTNKWIDTPENVLDLGAQSIRARSREEIPDLIREWDIGKIAGRWVNSVPEDLFTRQTARKIRAEAESLRAQDPDAYKYIQGYLNNLAGVKRGIPEVFDKMKRKYATNLYQKAMTWEEKATSLKTQGDTKGAWKARKKADMLRSAAEAPQFLQMVQNQFYPAFLGLRPDANLRNLTQPYAYTVQAISANPAYQAKLASKGLKNTIVDQIYTSKEGRKELENLGLTPAEPTPGAFMELHQGIAKHGGWKGKAKKSVEKLNNAAMYLYQQADLANRLVTLSMAKTVAKDALAGNKHALTYAKKLPASYRRRLAEAMASKNEKEAVKIIASHLNATTQFNYNKQSMSEYSQVMGPMFAMFSKWPTAITGDIVNTIDSHRLSKATKGKKIAGATKDLANKYLGPLILLGLTDHAIDQVWEDSPEKDFIIPKSGFSSSAPLTSATGILTSPERSLVPPVISAISDLSNLNPDTAMGVLPAYPWARFTTKQLPLLMGEEGQTPTEFIKDKAGIE